MSSELCAEDVVVRLAAPQVITAESGAAAEGGAGRGAAGGAELGRRLLLAARAGDTALVLDLMAKGAPFTTDWLGTSPLHLAAGNAHALTCAVLLRAGVSRDARTKVERTPLHLAAAGGHAAVAALLLDHGARVDPRDMLHMTPLHWAVQRGHTAVAAVLLKHGADPSLRSKFLRSARDMAARAGHAALLALLDRAPAGPRASPTHLTPTTPTTYETGHRIADVKPIKPKAQPNRPPVVKIEQGTEETGGGGGGGGGGRAAALLRAHGITLLPPDHDTTVLTALQSGRTIVLSDAGKLMLKESVPATSTGAATPASTPTPAPAPAPTPTPAPRVVVRARPARSPPRPGVKIFTLNNKLLALPADNNTDNGSQPQDFQMKVVRASGVSRGVKAKSKPAVKIIMNKANFTKLLANASLPNITNVTNITTGQQLSAVSGAVEVSASTVGTGAVEAAGTVETLGAGGTGGSTGAAGDTEASLRAQLGAARRAITALSAELQACRTRLAAYEQL